MRKKAINIKKILSAGALALVGFFIVLNAASTAFAADFIIQNDPFVFQATAGNNESLFFEVEDRAEILEKRGYSVIYNQLNDPDNFESQISLDSNDFYIYNSESTNYSFELIYETSTLELYDENDTLIDLTTWFGGNFNIPEDILDNADNFAKYYQGEFGYSAGTIINSNAKYLYTIGRNQWNEEWEIGGYSTATGEKVVDSVTRSKNYIRVLPNTTYFERCSIQSIMVIFFYDIDKNYLGYVQKINNTFKTPNNCAYITFRMQNNYGTTYNNDITISIYYEGVSGYEQYYPYEILSEIDMGDEILRGIGGVFDYKLPSGEIIRNIGEREYEEGDETDSNVITDGEITYYLLEDPIFENGTSYENILNVDRLGSMFWGGIDFNGIPQGNEILYQVPGDPTPPPPPVEDPERNDFNTGIIVIIIIIILIAIITNIEDRGR